MRAFGSSHTSRVVVVYMLATALAGAGSVRAADRPDAPFAVRLPSRTFTPQAGAPFANLPTSQGVRSSADHPARVHLLVQPIDPRDRGWRSRLESHGVRFLQYVPDQTWIVSAPADAGALAALSRELRWGDALRAEDRAAPDLLAGGAGEWAIEPDGRVRLRVAFHADVPEAEARAVLRAVGAEVLAYSPRRSMATVLADAAVVNRLAGRDEVAHLVEAPPEAVGLNDGALANIHADMLRDPPYSLDGSGVKIGMWDTGNIDATHVDLAGRVTLAETVGTTGHATHVAGTLGGTGDGSAARGGTTRQWRGVAAGVHFYSYLFDTPIDDHASAVDTFGIDVSQNSWGYNVAGTLGNCTKFGDYIWDAPEFDAIVTGFYGRRIPVVFAVGNDRDDGDCGIDARGGYACVAPPATAKNVITVGATLSDTDSMTIFSSWGPVDDGRIRPDLVTPGCQASGDNGIKSTEPGDLYGVRCGTSMAAPQVSGVLALLLQEHADLAPGDPAPLPSSLKGLLIQTARDLGRAGPDYSYGWGAVDGQAAVDVLRHQSVIEDQADDLETVEIPFVVSAADSFLRVTLVWDDQPALEGANPTLVNDLDLELIDPSLGVWSPFVLDPANPSLVATTGTDTVNNVEQVAVTSPAAGVWTCRVTGRSVPVGPQLFSILGIDLNAPDEVKNLALEAIGDSTVDLRWENPEALDLAGALVVRSYAATAWTPEDGTVYTLGQEVTAGVFVVNVDDADHSVSPLSDNGLIPAATVHYRAFSYDMHANYAAAAEDSILVGNPYPAVVSTVPSPVTIGAARDVSPVVTFASALDTTTADGSSIRVVGSLSGLHPATIAFASQDREVQLDPDDDFLAGETVTVVLTPDVHSAFGFPLENGYQFTFSVEAPGSGQGIFQPWSEFSTGGGAAGVLLVDWDGDGDADGAVANANANSVTILRNDGGVLAPDSSYATGAGSGPADAVALDLDGDGDADLAVTLAGGGGLAVFENVGGALFALDSLYALGGAPGGIVAADLDADGFADLAVSLESADSLVVLHNEGNGTLAEGARYATGGEPRGVAAADMDGDGDLDLALAVSLAGQVVVFLNDGTGSLTPGWSGAVSGRPSALAVLDVEGDGDVDLAVVRRTLGLVQILTNDGTGALNAQPSNNFAVGTLPWSIAAADVDADDDLDLLVSVRQDEVLALLRNTSPGFAAAESWSASGLAGDLAAGDLEGDGDVDVLLSLPTLASASVFLNVNPATGVASSPGPGYGLSLQGVRPNPFRADQSVVAFTLDRTRPVHLRVYDVTGRQVVELVNGIRQAGFHQVRWNGRDARGEAVSPGVYFLRLEAGETVRSRKVILTP